MRARHWILALAVGISACGGGGEEVSSPPPPQDHPSNVGAGRIWIESPAQDYVTDRDAVVLSGTAFISDEFYRCCSGTAQDTGVSVSWHDSAGGGGSASQSAQYCRLPFGPAYLCGHSWDAAVPLTIGTHTIVVSASDGAGNVGYDSIRVTRVPDTTPPTVLFHFPEAGATSVPTNSAILVWFSAGIDPASLTPEAIAVTDRDGNRVPGTLGASAFGGAKFTFAGTLAMNMLYTVTAGAGVRDESGNVLQAPRVWSFTTGAVFDAAPPVVLSSTPPDGTACSFIDTKPTVAFDEAIDPATVTSQTFQLTDGVNAVPGEITALGHDTFRFRPNLGLRYSSSYAVTVTSGIQDLAGNPIAANHTWTFSTVGVGTGTWRSTATPAGASGTGHTAVWTGTEMILWGGNPFDYPSPGDGYRYNPALDTWAPLESAGAPTARRSHVAVWTGSDMIVWGGATDVLTNPGNPPQVDTVLHADGARYNPATDTWSPISPVNAPTDPASAAVWTGGELIVWTDAGGAKYDPATDAWQALPAPLEPILGAKAVWTGSKLVVWGSSAHVAGSTGAVYDPATNSWQAISNANAPRRLGGQSAVWTGTQLIVWGGHANGAVDAGGIYNLQADAWRPLANCGASPRAEHSAVWTGSEMIVWGGSNANTGQAYNPVTDTWRQLDVVNAPVLPGGHTAVWTGHEMIVWGGIYVP